MKKHIILILLISLFLFFIILSWVYMHNQLSQVFSNAYNNANLTIIVDAGHGGEDGGAVAPDGSTEKTYNLDIALKLEKVLEFYGFNVIMTRTQDVMTCDEGLTTQRQKKVSDIRNRLKIIKDNPNAIFVSVHQNNFYDKTQQGTQVFYSGNNLKSKVLAEAIQSSVKEHFQPDNRRVAKKAGTEIYLLYNSNVPSVLVECGFLSNGSDLDLLKSNDYKQMIAMLIADGIIKYSSNR